MSHFFLSAACVLFLGAFPLNSHENIPQKQADRQDKTTHCPCGCGCVGECACGCTEGYPCNCPQEAKKVPAQKRMPSE